MVPSLAPVIQAVFNPRHCSSSPYFSLSLRSSQGEQCQKPYTSPGRQHPLLLPHPSGWSWLYRCSSRGTGPTSLPLGNPAGLAFLPDFLFTVCDAVLLEEVIPEYSPGFFCSFPPLPSQPPPPSSPYPYSYLYSYTSTSETKSCYFSSLGLSGGTVGR